MRIEKNLLSFYTNKIWKNLEKKVELQLYQVEENNFL